MDSPNGLEQAQVRPPQALLVGNRDNDGCARVSSLMHRMSQPWHEAVRSLLFRDRPPGEVIPLFIVLWKLAFHTCQHARKKAAGVFCDAEEARAASQQACRHRSLKGIRRAVQGQAGGDGRWSKAVIGQ